MRYRKILILGGPFSGTSWLAHSLGDVTGIGTWDASSAGSESDAALAAALSCESWIVASQAPDPEGETLRQADLIVFMRTPLWLRALRLVRGLVTRRTPWRRPRDPGPSSPRGRPDAASAPASKVFVCRSSEDVRRLLEGAVGLLDVERRHGPGPSPTGS